MKIVYIINYWSLISYCFLLGFLLFFLENTRKQETLKCSRNRSRYTDNLLCALLKVMSPNPATRNRSQMILVTYCVHYQRWYHKIPQASDYNCKWNHGKNWRKYEVKNNFRCRGKQSHKRSGKQAVNVTSHGFNIQYNTHSVWKSWKGY